MNTLRIFLIAFVLAHVASASQAMEIAQNREQLLMSGEIKVGDAEKLIREIFRQNDQGFFAPAMWLDSPGGSIVEAMKIGQLIKTVGIFVRVRNGGICASSCSFLYFSSNMRYAKGTVNGRMPRQDSGYVGLHRPYFSGNYSQRDQLGEVISQQSDLMQQISSYLRKENVPHRLIDEMMSRPSNDVYWMTQADIDQVGQYSPGYEEILIQRCGYSRQWKARLSNDYDRAERIGDKSTMARLDGDHDIFIACKGKVDAEASSARLKTIERLKAGWRPWNNQSK